MEWPDITDMYAILQAAVLLAAPCMILYIEGSINARNDDGKMMKNGLLKLVLFSGMISLGGCSSVMSHTGGKEGTYPGTRASAQMLGDSDANWGTKSLVALDMPLTAVMDTLLLPWDMFRTDSSVKSRVEKSEKETLATNSVIPPAPMPNPDLARRCGYPQLAVTVHLLHPGKPFAVWRKDDRIGRRRIFMRIGQKEDLPAPRITKRDAVFQHKAQPFS